MARFNSSRWLSSLVAGIFAFMMGTVLAQIVQRPINPSTGKSAGVSYFTTASAPTVAADGEVGIRSRGVGTPSELVFWDSASQAGNTVRPLASGSAASWVRIPSEDDLVVEFNGLVTQNVTRQDFNQSSINREAADFTVELVSDAGVNLAIFPSGGGPNQGINMFEFRLDGAHASPFIVDGAGALDIDNDGAADEGVEAWCLMVSVRCVDSTLGASTTV